MDEVGVGPWPGDWPDDPRLDPELLEHGDRRNVVDRYRYWRREAVVEDLDLRRHEFHVAIENWQHDFNIGSVVRTANAFRAREVHVVGRRRWNRRGAMVTDRYQHLRYHDDVESCRSMKHYFSPKAGVSAATMQIFAPVDGTVLALDPESSGFGLQLAIRPTAQPAFRLIIFHLTPGTTLRVGDTITAGQLLGTHYGTNTDADVAVSVNSTEGYRLVSWFEVITDSVFDEFRAAGIGSRDDMIMSRGARDADPLSCNAETFTTPGTIPSWVSLR